MIENIKSCNKHCFLHMDKILKFVKVHTLGACNWISKWMIRTGHNLVIQNVNLNVRVSRNGVLIHDDIVGPYMNYEK